MGDERMKTRTFILLSMFTALCLTPDAFAQKKGGGGNGGGGGDEGPAAAQTNPALVFTVDDRKQGNYLVVASADLASEIRLNNFANENTYSKGPSWSPDGSKIAYWEVDGPYDGPYRLYVINADGNGRTLVRDFGIDPGLDYPQRSSGEWSPSGRELVFAAGNVASLRAIDLTTGNVREILPFGNNPTVSPDLDPATEGYQGMVAFSAPDGSQYNRQGQWLAPDDIYLAPLTLDADGRVLAIDPADVVNLTDAPYSHQVPHSWSPDGRRLLYLDTNDPLDDEDSLVAENLETETVIELARVPINNNFGDATWTADGNFVVFELYGELMIVPSDGSVDPINYSQTRNDSEKQPAWNPNWDPSGDGGF